MAGHVPRLTTPRLTLSSFVRSDAVDVFAYASNPNVARFTTWNTHTALAEAEAFLESVLRRSPREYCWALRLHEQPTVIGAIEFSARDPRHGEIHFVLAEAHWNKGLMTEAARAVLTWAFETLPNLERISTAALRENIGFRRVLEKCGLAYYGTHREQWPKFEDPVDLSIYSIQRRTWQESKKAAT